MVKIIMGHKGSGKTKRLISMVAEAAESSSGNVVCIEKEDALRFDIPHSVRLVSTTDYSFGSYTYLKGFICGLHAGNYDITHIFIDNLYKIVNSTSLSELEGFVMWCDSFGRKENIDITFTVSEDPMYASETIETYLI